jgi:hypothetical protein
MPVMAAAVHLSVVASGALLMPVYPHASHRAVGLLTIPFGIAERSDTETFVRLLDVTAIIRPAVDEFHDTYRMLPYIRRLICTWKWQAAVQVPGNYREAVKL